MFGDDKRFFEEMTPEEHKIQDTMDKISKRRTKKMKGIIIYENDLRRIDAVKLKDVSFSYEPIADDITDTLEGRPVTCESANCSKDDTYDFETGALIALMKMCGREKALKAVEELYFLKEPRGADLDGDVLESEAEYMAKENKRLTEENKNLKKENEKLKNERDKLERLLRYTKDDINKKLEYIKEKDKEIKKLREEINQKNEENNRLKNDCDKYFKTVENLVIEKNELIEKKKDLKKKLNAIYGYIDTDNVKPELPRTLDINGTVYRKSIQIKDFGEQISKLTADEYIKRDIEFTRKYVDEWLYKLSTKRGDMWWHIKTFKDDSCVEVDWPDTIDFLEDLEKEMPEIHWPTGDKPTGMKPMFNYKYAHEYNKVYFFIDDDYITYAFGKETSRENVQYVTYLPPMRWDLFKKGRIVVGCTEEEVPEFREKVVRELGNVRMEKYSVENLHCNGPIRVYFHYDKNTNWLKPLLVSGIPRVKVNNHKVVYWEDVR